MCADRFGYIRLKLNKKNVDELTKLMRKCEKIMNLQKLQKKWNFGGELPFS